MAAAPSAPGQCPDVLTAEAYQCKAMRAVRGGNSAEAAEMFEQGAGLAAAREQAAKMLAAAGNLWISADQPDKAAILAKNAGQFPKVKLFSVDDAFGGWTAATKIHFADGGSFFFCKSFI